MFAIGTSAPVSYWLSSLRLGFCSLCKIDPLAVGALTGGG